MENNNPYRNDSLVVAIRDIRENENPENQNRFINELITAKFLVPVKTENEDVSSEGKRVIGFSSLTNHDGDNFFMAYTDVENLKKWDKLEDKKVVQMDYYQIIEITLKPDANYSGFVINPFSDNFVFLNKNIPVINNAVAKGSINASTPKTMFGIPKTMPDGVLESLTEMAKTNENIKEAYFCMMLKENIETFLVILDIDDADERFFEEIEMKCSEIFGNDKLIKVIRKDDDLARRALSTSLKAFYTKED